MDQSFKAIIMDMDGVITQTAKLHAQAWKEMFDDFLKNEKGSDYEPLDIEKDYKTYIDGISRFDGVRNFLESRNIDLPEGSEEDGPDKETVYGLGMRKNDIFLELLDKKGADKYEDALEMIKIWKNEGKKLAVISASRNCKHILKSAGVLEWFDVRVDGNTLEEEDLKGKPEPDIFLRACELLKVKVDQAVVIEDAIPGVKAGKKGNFPLVIGVDRSGEGDALNEAGADIVVSDMTVLKDKLNEYKNMKTADELPDANKNINEIFARMGSKKPALFLDYDGTLTPIVPNPEDAIISDQVKKIIEELSQTITVGVISGRDRKNVQSMVGLDSVIYAGSHGFDITGPDDLEMQYGPGKKTLPHLDEAEKNLNEKLKNVEGCKVERKKFAIAVHFRNVAEEEVDTVKEAVEEELKNQDKLKKGTGKKILELKPDLDWHKGKALTWLMDKLELKSDTHIPIFIGDDITDEDALEAIKENGIGIIVGPHDYKTSAKYQLEDTEETIRFLEKLKNRLNN